MEVALPKIYRILFRQSLAQRIIENIAAFSDDAVAKKIEKRSVVSFLEEGNFKMKQCILARVDVHAMHFGRVVEQVIEGIAAGAGKHDNAALFIHIQQLTVAARVFPASIVNQAIAMNLAKNFLVECMRNAHEQKQ